MADLLSLSLQGSGNSIRVADAFEGLRFRCRSRTAPSPSVTLRTPMRDPTSVNFSKDLMFATLEGTVAMTYAISSDPRDAFGDRSRDWRDH